MFSNTPVNAYMDMPILLFHDFLDAIAAIMEARNKSKNEE